MELLLISLAERGD